MDVATLAAAFEAASEPETTMQPHLTTLGLTLGYVVVGVLTFGLSFALITIVTPFSIRKEIEEDQNTSLGIIIGSVIIGLSIIIGAAIHGN
jgi:uncharacterized membrane protein YjfL (UPF0719 family)